MTAFLVRSLSSGWSKGSVVAVDGGVHLGAIVRILEESQPAGLGTTEALALPYRLETGPFAGLQLPHASPAANAAHVHRSLIDTYLITHPHLDHISGFVINTAGLPGSRPKRLAGLPSTIAAFKTHIFNNVIWPNLSDENNGAGLVTYMRLVEGGSPALGDGDAKGYLEITDGLAVKVWGVSHGHCIEKHSHRGSGSSTRYGSMDAASMGMAAMAGLPLLSPRALAHHNSVVNPSLGSFLQAQQAAGPATPVAGYGLTPGSAAGMLPPPESVCVYDSSAYFIRDVATGREILIFGDVEPDSISLSPRNLHIWQEAAPKIAAGKLAAVFLECSYDDSQSVDRLFGHLAPRYIAEEMAVLAQEVTSAKLVLAAAQDARPAPPGSGPSGTTPDKRKRKWDGEEGVLARRKTSVQPARAASVGAAPKPTSEPSILAAGPAPNPDPDPDGTTEDAISPRTVKPPVLRSGSGSVGAVEDLHMLDSPHLATPTAELSLRDVSTPATPLSMQPLSLSRPLHGLKIVIVHVKDKMDDEAPVGETVLAELLEYEREALLGCEYVLSAPGQDMYM